MASVQLQGDNNPLPNTLIHICPVDDSWDSTIRQYFSQFGEVESIAYHSNDDFGYGLVQFENAESATMAIAKCKHNIGGTTVAARAADIQTEFKVPAADSPCNILNKLNEHCLMEIFEYLSGWDLCSVGNVCNKFQAVAKKVFSVKAPVMQTISIRNWSLFRLFGTEIKTIDLYFGVNDEEVDNRILDLLATYCSESACALKKITIQNWNIKGEFMERLKAVAAKLLSNCNDLIDLQLRYIDFGNISKVVLPKLESVNIEQIPGLNDFIMNRFLESHPQLKKLTIAGWSGNLTPKAFRNVGVNISEFRLLGMIEISTALVDVDSMLDHLKRLKNLKSLGLNCSSLSADRVLGVLIEQKLPIEELLLTNFQIDSSFVKAIKSLEHLKKIHFAGGDWDHENLFVEIVKAHPQLQSIRLDSFGDVTVNLIIVLVEFAPTLQYMKTDGSDYDCINYGKFKSIVKSVKNRPTKTKLKIELHCHGLDIWTWAVPELLEMKSCEWLEIELEGGGSIFYDDDDWSDDEISD